MARQQCGWKSDHGRELEMMWERVAGPALTEPERP